MPDHSGKGSAEWIELLRSGDKTALKPLYEQHYLGLFAYVLRLLKRDVNEAEDITAETFGKLWEHRRDVKDPDHLKNWLYLVARNAALDHLKKMSRMPTSHAEPPQDIASENTMEIEKRRAGILEALYKEVDSLPPQEKEFYKLMYKEGKSGKEVAALLGISESTVTRYKERILSHLRTELLKRGLRW